MKRKSMAVLTIVTVALLMSWVVPALSADLQKVNINTAALEELMTLDGIGPAVAERILAFRDKNGPFQKPEDLMLVKGIGQIMFDKNSARIIVKDK
jgi:competence protein ComEA